MKKITTRILLFMFFLVLTVGLFLIFQFSPLGIPGLKQIQPDAVMPDMLFFPGPGDLLHNMELMGNEGRAFYRQMSLSLDILFPVSYMTLFLLGFSFLIPFAGRPRFGTVFSLFPVLAALSDLGENYCFLRITLLWPDYPMSLVKLSQALSCLKFMFIFISFLCVLLLLAWHFRQYNTGRKSN